MLLALIREKRHQSKKLLFQLKGHQATSHHYLFIALEAFSKANMNVFNQVTQVLPLRRKPICKEELMGIVPVKNHRCPITILREKPSFKQNHNDWFPERLNYSKFGASVFYFCKNERVESDALSFCQALCNQAGKILIKNVVLTRGKIQEHLMKVILRIIHSEGNTDVQHSNVGNQVNKNYI